MSYQSINKQQSAFDINGRVIKVKPRELYIKARTWHESILAAKKNHQMVQVIYNVLLSKVILI
jgi:hypothetical protein